MRTRGRTATDHGRRIGVVDVLFVVVFAAYTFGALGLLAQGLGAVFASASDPFHESLHLRGFQGGIVGRAALRMADAAHHVPSGFQVALDYLFSTFNLVVAGLLLWLRPRDRTSRLLAIGLVGAAGVFNLTAQGTFEILPLTQLEALFQGSAHILAGLAYVFALLLFPTGRLIPRWPKWALALLYGPLSVGIVAFALRVEGDARPAFLILFFGLAAPAAGVLAQAYRFQRSPNAEAHQQARLLFWALLPALVVGTLYVVTRGVGPVLAPEFAGRHLPEQPVALFRVFQPVFGIIPIALLAGILRYRLWDVDRLINKTLVYGLATAVLGGAYLGIVVLLQRIFQPLTEGNDLAVAASTLAVAAAFRPLLRRIQAFVDRRFYRRRYDAVRTIEAFSVRLRDHVDLDALGDAVCEILHHTMQPEHVSLWLRPPSDAVAIGASGLEIGRSEPDEGPVEPPEAALVTVPGRPER